MRSALVFGGTGQIGVPVVSRLLAENWRVLAVSRHRQPSSGHLQWHVGDLQNLPQLPPRVDAIFSLGPLDHFSRWYDEAVIESPRVVAFGSTSLDTKPLSSDAGERALAHRLKEAEDVLFAAGARKQANVTVLRPTLVYGAARDKTLTPIGVMARRTGWFVLPRHAHGLRQPVHVDDLVQATLGVLQAVATHGKAYSLPGGETLAYREMVRRTLACLQPPARLLEVPRPVFATLLAGAHALGRLRAINAATVKRMGQDLVFDVGPAQRDFGYAPRAFDPHAEMFIPQPWR